MRQRDGSSTGTSSFRPSAALAILFLVSLLNYLDRFVLGILLPVMKADLHLTDTELGFVTGGAFSIFYAFAGMPIGRLADRRSRRGIIGVALALWSAMTIACGVAQTFLQLVMARILLGVGEAGATPPSHSLIADIYPPERRAWALAVFSMGMPLGIMLGFLVGGFAAEEIGWRWTLAMFGVAGLVLAAVAARALPDPPRGASEEGSRPAAVAPLPLGRALGQLARCRSFLHLCLGSGCYAVIWSGLIIWLPSYFTRSFHLPVREIALPLALVLGTSQTLGLAAGGRLADRMGRRDARWLFWTCAAGTAASLPFFALALLWQSPVPAMIALFPAFLLALLQGGPAAAIVQAVASRSTRALAVSVYLVAVNLIAALGTQLIGVFSDRLSAAGEGSALGTAMLLVTVLFSCGAALNFLLGARYLRAEAEAARTA